MNSDLEETGRLLGRTETRLRSLDAPASALPGRERLGSALGRIERRLREGPGAPLRVAFFGPTGAGKSKLFNTLAGGEVSPAGFRRPCTMVAVHLVHEDRRDLAESLGVRWRSHRRDAWRDLILIDTPDFDSVERANRQEAERVLLDADGFVFVTDVHKYGDRSTWEYIERILATGRPLAIVLNKVTGPEAVGDFFARLDRRLAEADAEARLAGAAGRRVQIGEHPVDDLAPLPADDPGVEQLAAAVGELVGASSEVRAHLLRGLRRELESAVEIWTEASRSAASWLAGVDSLRQRIGEEFETASDALSRELRTEVDADVKKEVFAKVLAGIERIDILKYPRRLLALPWRGLQSLYHRVFPAVGGTEDSDGKPNAATDGTFQLVEARVLELVDGLRAALRAEERCPEASSPALLDAVRVGHDELREGFDAQQVAFGAWLQREVEETAGQLTGEHKLKFIVAQLLYNSVVIGVQVHTGGGLMLTEVLTDAVLSPLVAKAVGLAVSSDRVAQFEETARGEHHRLLVVLLEDVRDRALAQVNGLDGWRGDVEQLDADMTTLRKGTPALCDAFVAGETTSATSGPASGEET